VRGSGARRFEEDRLIPRANRRRAGRLLVIALAALACTIGVAQTEDGPPLINFAFASQLGTGIYQSGEQTVQVYRISVPFTIRSEDDHRWGARLLFPVGLGFYGFRTADFFEGNLPQDVSTVTVAVAAEFPIRFGEHWTVGPRGEIGYARDLRSEADSRVYAVGLRTAGVYERDRRTWMLHGRLVWAGQSEARLVLADDFLRLQTAVEVRHPLPLRLAGRAVDLGTFAASHVFFDSIDFFRFPQQIRVETVDEIPQPSVAYTWEIGLTLGLDPRKIGRVPVPRLGLSYRFGDDVSAVRFVIGAVF
jgi:hypothetical protein